MTVLFHTALPAAIQLNDGGPKGDSLELGNLERDNFRSSGEIVVVSGHFSNLALFVELVPGSQGEFFCLGFQQLVKGFLYAASH